jgi:mannosylglycerate hydrolase
MPQSDGASLEIHVLTHTHWDREWYARAEEFRLALVDLVDEILAGAAGPRFLLDGQSIVLDDYLDWRPSRRAELSAALREGRIEAGPWYVLADNLIPGAEAIVRNLLRGRDVIRALGGTVPPVLYCPDAFGHPAAMPILGVGFGFHLAVVWRGYGGERWPSGDTARWRARDGSEVLLHHLPPDGYEFGSNLPDLPEAARARWRRMRQVLGERSSLGVVLVQNGADHHAVQLQHAAAVRALADAAAPEPVRMSSLSEWAAAVRTRAATVGLPIVSGELRDSTGYVWSLQGTLGSRAAQKRRNAAAERLLVRDVEPWNALAAWHTGHARSHETNALWRLLLACHPHDTLCGCSIDAVAAAMDERLSAVDSAGRRAGLRARLALLGHEAASARERERDWRHVVVVRNCAARPRGGIAVIEVDAPLAPVPVGPGSGGAQAILAPSPVSLGDVPLQLMSRRRTFVRDESPRHYPRNDLVERRTMLAWIPPVDGYGLATLPVQDTTGRRPAPPSSVRARDGVLDNGILRLEMSAADGLTVETNDGLVWRDVLGFESVGERGDLYTHAPIPQTFAAARLLSHRVTLRGPLRAAIASRWRVSIAARSLHTATGELRTHPEQTLEVKVRIELDAAAPFARLVVAGENRWLDHRLRLVLRTGIAGDEVWSDSAFGAVRRPPVAPPAQEWPHEHVVPTAPLHRWVTRFGTDRGLTLVSDGLAEYEATPHGDIAVTLLRATGELSRNDLRERPGHAGWPTATPSAQSPGPFESVLALFPHGPASERTWCDIDRVCEDALLPLCGESWRSALEPPPRVEGLVLEGEGLAFSGCLESDDGSGIVLRCVNVLDRVAEGSWRLRGIREAWLARLDETALGALPVSGDHVRFQAAPHAVVTVVVRKT